MRVAVLFVVFISAVSGVSACSTGGITPTSGTLPAPQATEVVATPGPSPTLPPPPVSKVLRIGLTAWPDVLDPQRAPLGVEVHLLRLVYEGLTTFDEKGNIVPGGADKWAFSTDGLQMTFHIRDGLKRADGAAVTARDFEYAIKRALDPRIRNKSNTELLYDIKGAQQLDLLDPL